MSAPCSRMNSANSSCWRFQCTAHLARSSGKKIAASGFAPKPGAGQISGAALLLSGRQPRHRDKYQQVQQPGQVAGGKADTAWPGVGSCGSRQRFLGRLQACSTSFRRERLWTWTDNPSRWSQPSATSGGHPTAKKPARGLPPPGPQQRVISGPGRDENLGRCSGNPGSPCRGRPNGGTWARCSRNRRGSPAVR
jgi:hypothetical protein